MTQQIFTGCTFSNDTSSKRVDKAVTGWNEYKERATKLRELADGIPTEELLVVPRERYHELFEYRRTRGAAPKPLVISDPGCGQPHCPWCKPAEIPTEDIVILSRERYDDLIVSETIANEPCDH